MRRQANFHDLQGYESNNDEAVMKNNSSNCFTKICGNNQSNRRLWILQ